MELSDHCTAVASVTDPRRNCTHQFDLAGLCVTHAERGTQTRQYDIELPPPHDWTVTPRLWRDGELVLEWELAVGKTRTRSLVSPPEFVDAPWRGGFMKWADQTFPPEEAEAAIVLRRSCDIGMGRGMDLEAIPVAVDLAELMTGICYSMQPDVMPVAFRNKGSIRDFGEHPDALLADAADRAGRRSSGRVAAVRLAVPAAGGGVAAVDVDRRPGHEPGEHRVGEEDDRRGHVVDVPGAGQRRANAHVLTDARGRDHVGRDAVDPDHPGPELEGEALGQARLAAFIAL